MAAEGLDDISTDSSQDLNSDELVTAVLVILAIVLLVICNNKFNGQSQLSYTVQEAQLKQQQQQLTALAWQQQQQQQQQQCQHHHHHQQQQQQQQPQQFEE